MHCAIFKLPFLLYLFSLLRTLLLLVRRCSASFLLPSFLSIYLFAALLPFRVLNGSMSAVQQQQHVVRSGHYLLLINDENEAIVQCRICG